MTLTAELLAAIRVRHQLRRPDWDTFATELRRNLDGDPEFPPGSVSILRIRYKSWDRLRQKLLSADATLSETPVTTQNYESHVKDLLGIRFVTLRPVEKYAICDFIIMQERQRRLRILSHRSFRGFGPQPFDPDPRVAAVGEETVGYEHRRLLYHEKGYSSEHFIVALSPDDIGTRRELAEKEAELAEMQAEVQVRTILEEAWSEVDHRYRFETERTGVALPDYVSNSFTDLSHLLESVARIQEGLCVAAEPELNPRSAAVEQAATDALSKARSPVGSAPAGGATKRSVRDAIRRVFDVELTPDAQSIIVGELSPTHLADPEKSFRGLIEQYGPEFREACRSLLIPDALNIESGVTLRELIIFLRFAVKRAQHDRGAKAKLIADLEQYVT